jgi:mono/diheme cytochrome c family protein
MIRLLLLLAILTFPLAACKRDDMADQARYKPLAASDFYVNGASARMPVPHTIDQEGIEAQDWMTWKTIRSAGSGARWHELTSATKFPFQITRADLNRGEVLFEINCSPCHGLLGDGEGMVPQRGFTRPPTYHSDRLRAASPAYFVDVITNGIGAMFPYADRVSEDDRWRIAAYIKALQLSEDAPAADLSPQDQQSLLPAASATASAPATQPEGPTR